MPISIGTITIPDYELIETFMRSSGPGGQNVNKVSTAVELRFDVRHSPSLPTPIAVRLQRLAGSRMTNEGVLVIRADRFRSQEQNCADARDRLEELVEAACRVPKHRVKTRPTMASKERRLKSKGVRAEVKARRRSKPDYD